MSTPENELPIRLLTRANENRCKVCPPDRICAWACVQGMGMEDILIGALLEQGDSWAFKPVTRPGLEASNQALWDLFNE
jgi:hypothetical protein